MLKFLGASGAGGSAAPPPGHPGASSGTQAPRLYDFQVKGVQWMTSLVEQGQGLLAAQDGFLHVST